MCGKRSSKNSCLLRETAAGVFEIQDDYYLSYGTRKYYFAQLSTPQPTKKQIVQFKLWLKQIGIMDYLLEDGPLLERPLRRRANQLLYNALCTPICDSEKRNYRSWRV